MLPLPTFSLHTPTSTEEAARILHELGSGAQVIAGGTDLLPNMKQGMTTPRAVVSLQRVASLRGVRHEKDAVRIGAMTTLEAVARDEQLGRDVPVLVEAAAAVGGPLHRRMGTLGGNVCLDTRCRYINQTHFWRDALGNCLKRDGTRCHVVPGGQNCVAAASNDTATALIALDATLELQSVRGLRTVAIRDFYTPDGIRNHVREDDEILAAVVVPKIPGQRSAYEKLRTRNAIDFPLLSVAARADLKDGRLSRLEVVVSALAARPRRLVAAQKIAAGSALDSTVIDTIAKASLRECHPLANIDGDEEWRHEMVPVLIRRVLKRLS